MKQVYENINGKVFYKNGVFLVKVKGLIGFMEFENYNDALSQIMDLD